MLQSSDNNSILGMDEIRKKVIHLEGIERKRHKEIDAHVKSIICEYLYFSLGAILVTTLLSYFYYQTCMNH